MVDYSQYKLHEREMIFKKLQKDLPEPSYAIMWEDPAKPDEPMRITKPSPTWLAMAMHGDILPPVEVYHALAEDEARPGFKRHTRGYLMHETKPLPAMTEKEAMEYLVQKDIPARVWRDYEGNREILKIVPVELVPTDRSLRNAWAIDQNGDERTAA
jgi:hypothetical protein